MTSIGYVRVSTDKQDNSVDAQEKRIRGYAAGLDLNLTDVIIDSDEYSGDLNRPGVQRVLDLVRAKKIDSVIITKLDRLTRSTRDAITLIELFGKRGVGLISINESLDTESPMGRFFVRMIASIAELEREMIGSRTAAGMQNLKAQGMPAGTAPYGWRNINEHTPEGKLIRRPLEEVPQEQAVLTAMNALRSQGLSYQKVAAGLNSAGYTTRRGTEWRYQYVERILSK